MNTTQRKDAKTQRTHLIGNNSFFASLCRTWMYQCRERRIRWSGRLCVGLVAALLAGPTAAGCSGTVYLTFDTGDMSQADTIARILKREQVRATFFLANEKTFRADHALDPTWRDYWLERVAEGHAFGNHTFRHVYARRDLAEGKLLATVDYSGPEIRLDERSFCAELKKADASFQALTGRHLDGLWRAPGGHTTRQTIRWAANCGYPLHVHWDEAGFIGDELSSETHSNDQLLKQALARIKPGTVTMMHLGIRSRRTPLARIVVP